LSRSNYIERSHCARPPDLHRSATYGMLRSSQGFGRNSQRTRRRIFPTRSVKIRRSLRWSEHRLLTSCRRYSTFASAADPTRDVAPHNRTIDLLDRPSRSQPRSSRCSPRIRPGVPTFRFIRLTVVVFHVAGCTLSKPVVSRTTPAPGNPFAFAELGKAWPVLVGSDALKS